MDCYTFYSIAQMRKLNTRANTLMCVLMKLYPDTFGGMFDRVMLKSYRSVDFSGLFVRYADGKVVCVSVIYDGAKLDRIFTLPYYRDWGFATQMLGVLRVVSTLSRFSFLSPVEKAIVPLFVAAQWTILDDTKENPDGTLDMLSDRAVFKEVAVIPDWMGGFANE